MKNVLIFMALLTFLTLGCKSSKEENQRATPQKEVTSGSSKQPEKGEKQEKTLVARVNGTPIYKENLHGRPLQDVINDEILYQEALKQGDDTRYADRVDEYKRAVIIGNVKKEIILSNMKPNWQVVTDADIDEFYNKNKDKYGKPNLRLKSISTEDKEIADQIHDKAMKGEEFEKIASEYSGSDKKVTVQETGGFTDSYNNRFVVLEVGQISNAFKSGKGYVILKIIEIDNKPTPAQKQRIKFAILNGRKTAAMEKGIEEIKQENNVKVEIVQAGANQ